MRDIVESLSHGAGKAASFIIGILDNEEISHSLKFQAAAKLLDLHERFRGLEGELNETIFDDTFHLYQSTRWINPPDGL